MDRQEAVLLLKAYLRRQWQAVPVARLSVFGLGRRTNNDCEAFFAGLGGMFATAHPSLWAFIGTLNQVCPE